MTQHQLWRAAGVTYAIPIARVREQLISRPAPRMRAMYWPDGRECWEVTAYLVSLRKKGKATSTINTYASELSHLVRFLDARKLQFCELEDANLFEFNDYLTKSGHLLRRRPGGSHVNRIICRSLGFLIWLQTKIPHANFVGLEGVGANITVEASKRRRGRWGSSIRHPSFSPESERVVVRPISEDNLEAILNACESGDGRRSFTRARDGQLVSLMADSGIRREEAVHIQVADVEAAYSDDGRLSVRTSKRRGNPNRQVPVPRETLRSVLTFAKVQRAIRMRKAGQEGFKDEGWLFCTQTGSQMKAGTVTSIFAKLKRVAGLTGRTAPHTLRHRWITAQLLRLIREVAHASPLSAGLMVTMLTRLAAMSGHGDPASLWNYVDVAYEQILAELSAGKKEVVAKGKAAVLEIRELLERQTTPEQTQRLLDAVLVALSTADANEYVSLSSRLERKGVSSRR